MDNLLAEVDSKVDKGSRRIVSVGVAEKEER